jgi:hypothetical protein
MSVIFGPLDAISERFGESRSRLETVAAGGESSASLRRVAIEETMSRCQAEILMVGSGRDKKLRVDLLP